MPVNGIVHTGSAEALRRIAHLPSTTDSIRLSELGLPSQELLAPVLSAGLDQLAAEIIGGPVACRLEHSWLRKRFAPRNAPPGHHPNSWHQDGGLGVKFPPAPGALPPMTRLVTCWITLDACGRDAPGLELIRHPLDTLLHFTELDDEKLRQRFIAEDFWSPELEPGDTLVMAPGVLHRTYVRPEMRHDRLSVEFRFFPA